MMDIREAVDAGFREALDFLKESISFRSISGEGEEEIQNFVREKFSVFGDAQLVAVPEDLKKDPEYTFAVHDLDYTRRKNLVLE